MKHMHALSGAALSALLVSAAAGQSAPFTAGNLVVSQISDGTVVPISNAAQAVFLKEITTSGSIVQTIPLPTVASVTGNRALTNSGTATSEGALTRSVDGRYLTLAGYNADVGTPAIASSTVSRVVGRIDALGNVDTTTEITDAYSGNNIRSACSIDGTGFWTGGTGTTAGVRYIALGGGPSTQLTTSVTNIRVVNFFNNQLYISTMSGAFRGVSTVGAPPPPTTTGQVATLLNGFDPSATSPETVYDYFFADSSTLYVADDRAPGPLTFGGIQKWTFDGTVWTQAYVLSDGLTAGCRGLTGVVSGGTATLYAITADAISATAGNKLVSVVDTGATSTFATLYTAPANIALRGVDFAPVAGGPAPCYANCDQSTTPPVLNVLDFSCFLNRFAGGDSYANCDGSTTPPVLNVLDFSCFLNRFAAGCT